MQENTEGARSVKQPFDGIRVLDLTHVLAGPFATYQLALLGADVIKIESPSEPDQARENSTDEVLARRFMGTTYLTQSSNKRSIALDLKTKSGRDILKRLVATADVLVENYRPGALNALGLGYHDLSKVNDQLIYCSMSAFGHSGPRSEQTAYDPVIQAATGLMAMNGTPAISPLKIGAAAVDYSTGTTGAFAIASALFLRERAGRGQRIDLAMFDTALMLVPQHLTAYLHDGSIPHPHGNGHRYATNMVYDTSDGQIVIAATNRKQQRRLWEAMGRPDLACPDRQVRSKDMMEHVTVLTALFKRRTAREWEDHLQAHHVPASRVYTLAEAAEEPQFVERDLIHRHEFVPGVEGPLSVPVAGFKFDHGGPRVKSPPPRVGENTVAILKEAGYSADDIAMFCSSGAVMALQREDEKMSGRHNRVGGQV
jgi:crotonobetainyl-CoA:carnitine CoA-transferase CaiB-like acyl-CoA transferase